MKQLALSIPGFGSIQSPSGIHTGGYSLLNTMLSNGLTILLIVTILLALFFMIWGGILWTMSGGEKQHLEQARSKITYSIIGLIVALLAFFIVNVIGGLFGIKLLNK